jgi:hypothetical protein
MELHGVLRRYLYFWYVADVRTAQKTHLWDSTACYGVKFVSF